MKKYNVYGMGAALVDTEIEVDDTFLGSAGIDKGVMTLVDEARQDRLLAMLSTHLVASRRASGGSAANSVIATSCFGGRAFYTCKVADDENGRFYLADMARAGVDCNACAGRESGVTGKCLVMITPDAERTMNTFLGISSTLSADNLDEAALAASEYLYVEGYLVTSPTGRAAAIAAREFAARNGVRTALSFSDPGIVAHFRDGLADMIGPDDIDLLFCNLAEAQEWTGAERLEDAAEGLRRVARSFAVTLGGEGALVFDGRHYHRIAPHPVKPIDTNGAGDMFAGAYIFGITNGFDAVAAGRLANRAAAELVTHYGPRLPAPLHRQLLEEFNREQG
ncbi:MAG: adenosine kinase [Gammaproteobacteria bacterium]|nr:adenosine kinase [Gammaproteobacteria bacterium]